MAAMSIHVLSTISQCSLLSGLLSRLTFISNHCHVRHHPFLEGFDNQPVPVIQVLEAVVIGDVVAHYHCLIGRGTVGNRCRVVVCIGRAENGFVSWAVIRALPWRVDG